MITIVFTSLSCQPWFLSSSNIHIKPRDKTIELIAFPIISRRNIVPNPAVTLVSLLITFISRIALPGLVPLVQNTPQNMGNIIIEDLA